METHTCPLCALARTTADAAGLSWSSQHERSHDDRRRTVTWICPTCTRAQLWLIEAGLPVVGDFTTPAVPLDRAA